MKNKSKTYILLVLVLGVWGVLGYKILSSLSGSEDVIPQQPLMDVANVNLVQEKDTFSILANYRDPFLGTITTGKKKSTTVTKTSKSNNHLKKRCLHRRLSIQAMFWMKMRTIEYFL